MKNKKASLDMKQYGMFIALIVIYLIFAILTGGKNLTPMNINNLVMQNGYVVILAIGMLLCVLTGNVDLGVGSVVALCGATAGIMMMDYKMNMWVAIIAALAIGLLVGMFAGFFIAYLSIPPFVVTLATMLMGRGLTYTLLQAQTKGPLPSNYNFIGAGFLPTYKIFFGDGILDLVSIAVALIASVALIWNEIRGIKTKKKYNFVLTPTWQTVTKLVIELFIIWFFFYKLARYNGLPFVLLIMVVLIGIYAFVTTKTVAGRQIYALGGNRKAANLSGIDTNKVFFWVYTNMGVLAAIAGIVLSARNGSSTPKAGDGFEMDAIASCYIGGAAVAGGSGSILGAVVGAFVMGVLNNGMSLFGWSTDIQKIVKGAVLLGAVTVDVLSKRKKN
ncbi:MULTISPECIES: multiple monosaccharide ABC transporter permease [Pseudobutyrivibrio]|uniref:Xylose transport system permease protein XylH n=2 Tax=Pseudobutyrivibrio ruminis TaxID=46206 RepID=A0A1H7G1A1_9FIRM|nr:MULTISPECIES: multiple monosaccharide ABC transporter permease [Pseudobutyrivibrio]SEK31834.1 putative multiple sugar transport system permease protein [Pseudobutyrivibrio ruminis]SFN95470.1 multiple monosaccharide ABC transporter membrane protein [Pseudobutyrivibrio sp. JW11]SOB92022.1 putative multiple sugar transport system permease protein [Pseudobutyrivibrio ruminis DSM 9787]